MLLSKPSTHSYTYHGHRKPSYEAADRAELVEIRARQRTLDGAYIRSSLLLLGNAVIVIKLFDPRFYNIGILFVLLAALISVIAYARKKHLNRDFSDQERPVLASSASHARIFGAPFKTAGWIVIAITFFVSSSHIVLIVLLLRV